MGVRRLIAAMGVGAALVGASAAPVSAEAPAPEPTLAELLAAQGPIGDGNWWDFDILNGAVGAILAANPASPLALAADADGPDLTVFMPNDRAFQLLAVDLLGWELWRADEAEVATALLAAIPIDVLETVVLYHVHVGRIDSATALSVAPGTAVPMVAGGEVRVYPLPGFGTAILADNDRDDRNALLVRRVLDVEASNGIAHGIFRVMRPIDL